MKISTFFIVAILAILTIFGGEYLVKRFPDDLKKWGMEDSVIHKVGTIHGIVSIIYGLALAGLAIYILVV